ncbi:MAG: hypothetical protein JNL80_06720 [Phycisphaerae bacterium]|jgi:hypothetical protein|nr:hypothetical protein [Phycisphaerae bacterium]
MAIRRSAILALLLAAATGVTSQAARPQQAAREPTPIADRHKGFGRMTDGVMLRREAVMAALASLERDVASIVADGIFRDYAAAAGQAREEITAALFPVRNGEPAASTLSDAEIANAARTFEKRLAEATDMAITSLARAGAHDEAGAAELRADLYRRILATSSPISRDPMRADDATGSDALTLWKEALDRDLVLAPAKAWMPSHPQFVTALERLRSEGERLSRARMEDVAEFTMFYAVEGADRIPADLRLDRSVSKKRHQAWLTVNHAMAEAIEKALLTGPDAGGVSGVGPLPAAVWIVRYLQVTRTDAVPSVSSAQTLIATATSFGMSEAEGEAMRSAVEQSMLARAGLFRRLVREYDEWARGAADRGETLFASPPPDRLVTAYDELDELDRTTRAKIVSAIESTFVRKRVKAIADAPPVPHLIPMWRSLQTGQAMMQGVEWGPAKPASDAGAEG